VRALAEESRDYLFDAIGVEVGERWFDHVEEKFQAAKR
jgi:hypothetical protein